MLTLIAHGATAALAPTVPVIVLAVAYVWAFATLHQRSGGRNPGTRHAVAFGLGALVLGGALGPALPVGRTLTAHMLQHVLVVGVAAPLLAFGMPVLRAFALLRPCDRRRFHELRRRVERARVSPLLFALVVHLAVVTLWHLPWLYELALGNDAVHAVQHVTFLASALVLWWAVLGMGSTVSVSFGRLAALLVLALHGALLGALLAFSAEPWYETYAAGGEALADQQVAGLLMWSLGSVLPVVVGFFLVATWLERPGTRRVRGLPPRTLTGERSAESASV